VRRLKGIQLTNCRPLAELPDRHKPLAFWDITPVMFPSGHFPGSPLAPHFLPSPARTPRCIRFPARFFPVLLSPPGAIRVTNPNQARNPSLSMTWLRASTVHLLPTSNFSSRIRECVKLP
jgi:hypothetical protein